MSKLKNLYAIGDCCGGAGDLIVRYTADEHGVMSVEMCLDNDAASRIADDSIPCLCGATVGKALEHVSVGMWDGSGGGWNRTEPIRLTCPNCKALYDLTFHSYGG